MGSNVSILRPKEQDKLITDEMQTDTGQELDHSYILLNTHAQTYRIQSENLQRGWTAQQRHT